MRLLMCHRGNGHDVESEPVLATLCGGLLELVLDDGDRLVFDFAELVEAVLADERDNNLEAA
jgi:hypothetical protein